MLTLEQIEEGRRRVRDKPVGSRDWLFEHAAELLDAAERVARQEAYAAETDGYDTPREPDPPPTEAEIELDRKLARVTARDIGLSDPDAYALADRAGRLAMLDAHQQTKANKRRRAAQERAAELEPLFWAEFGMRPFVADENQHMTNPHAFHFGHVKAWYRAQGVVVRVDTDPGNPSHLRIEPIELIR